MFIQSMRDPSTMVRRSRLTRGAEKRLLALGLTVDQVYWINHHFQAMADDLRAPPRHAEVRAELEKIDGHLAKVDHWCARASRSALRQSDKVALNHIGIAAADWRRLVSTDQISDTVPERIDLPVLIQSLRQVVAIAKKNFPKHLQRHRQSAIRVIETLEMAINRPDDAASKSAAKQFEVSRSPGSRFLAAAEIIFEEAIGEQAPSPGTAIRALKAQRSIKPLSGEGG